MKIFPFLPLVHVMFCVVKPHAHLDGVTFADPVKNVLHLGCPTEKPFHRKIWCKFIQYDCIAILCIQ
jgi:hypothetical protein